MNLSEIPENPLIFLSWVTALGLFLSLTEATLKIKYEKLNTLQKRQEYIDSLYPKILFEVSESKFACRNWKIPPLLVESS